MYGAQVSMDLKITEQKHNKNILNKLIKEWEKIIPKAKLDELKISLPASMLLFRLD